MSAFMSHNLPITISVQKYYTPVILLLSDSN
jgi:hypothetical protein